MLEEAIRAGDCLAMLVEHFYDCGKMREAYNYLKEMEDRKIALHPYVDAEVLEAVFKAVGKSVSGDAGDESPIHHHHANRGSNDVGDDDDDIVEDEIAEEDDEV